MTAPLPDWLEPLPDAERMRATDAWGVEEQGVPSLDLMERAGAGLARLTADLTPEGAVAVVCGKGNNGGDGLVAARLLREAGDQVAVVFVAPPDEVTGEARTHPEHLPGEAPVRLSGASWASDSGEPGQAGAGALTGAGAVVDALLGTG